ncbi:hypothetical protein Tdes44962_MAKER03765 [Teratosphaeria destructans]|uniref:Uncharacterized protein n=1 Tax=Teratosphaeria destructans TaxID=418781 RepID=A0A9W7SP72_9PEZI|nr:hypothetical protein Tdes44962_MAKER03765 [Teratosphaeria destructans]
MYHGHLPLLGEGQGKLNVDVFGHGVKKTQLLRDSGDGSRRVPAEGRKRKEREREKGGFFHRLKQKAT